MGDTRAVAAGRSSPASAKTDDNDDGDGCLPATSVRLFEEGDARRGDP